MAKDKISQWDQVASNNTDVGGINLGEGMLPSDVNNAMREMMAQIKDQQIGYDGDSFTVGGNLTVNGTVKLSGASEKLTITRNNFVGTGSISTTVLNISAMTSGTIYVGDIISGLGVTAGTYITSFGTGSGQTGTYNLSSSQTVSSITISGFTGDPSLVINSTDAVKVPVGTSAQRPQSESGLIRYNSDLKLFEGYTQSWQPIGSGATGGVGDFVFVENDTLITQNYLLGQGAIIKTVTTTASDILTSVAHNFAVNQLVQFSTTGTLSTILTQTGYWVVSVPTADTFKISATQGGTAITLGGAGTGSHTVGKLKNASSSGSVTIATGATVTIPTNATWSIV